MVELVYLPRQAAESVSDASVQMAMEGSVVVSRSDHVEVTQTEIVFLEITLFLTWR